MALTDEIKQTKGFATVGDEVYISLLRTADVLEREFHHLLKQSGGLTPVQYNVLRILRGAGDDGRTCSEIAERLITNDPDVTRLLDRMERHGWIQRRRSEQDRRVVRAFLAGDGRKLVDRLDEPVQAFTRSRFKSIGVKRLKDLIGMLEEIRNN